MSCVTWVTKWNSAALTRVEWWPFWQISSANSKQFYFISLIFFYRNPQTLYSRAQGFWWSFSCDDLRAGNNIYIITMTCASSHFHFVFSFVCFLHCKCCIFYNDLILAKSRKRAGCGFTCIMEELKLLYVNTSVCIFASLFSMHFLRCWQEESV